MGYQPPAPWLEEVLVQVVVTGPELSPGACLMVVQSLSRLSAGMSPEQMARPYELMEVLMEVSGICDVQHQCTACYWAQCLGC